MATNGGAGPNPVNTSIDPVAFAGAWAGRLVAKVDPSGGEISEPDLDENHGQLTQNFVEDTALSLQARDARLLHAIGTDLVVGDVAVGAGWGAAAGKVLDPGSRDARGVLEVTANGAGIGAKPFITVTFVDGAFPTVPFPQAQFVGGTGEPALVIPTATVTTLVLEYQDLPVAGFTYRLGWSQR